MPNKVIPVTDEEIKEVKKEPKADEGLPIIRPGTRRTSIEDLIEKQNNGLEQIKKINEVAHDLNLGEDFIKEINDNAISQNKTNEITEVKEPLNNHDIVNDAPKSEEDIKFIEEVTKDTSDEEMIVAERLKQENPIFDYNAPISNGTFGNDEEMMKSLSDTLNELNKTSEEAKEATKKIKEALKADAESIKIELVGEKDTSIKEIEAKVDEEDTYTLDTSEDVVIEAKEEVKEEIKEEIVDKILEDKEKEVKPVEDDSLSLEEEPDQSIFSGIQSLKEEDLDHVTKEVTSDIVVPLSDYATIEEAVIDSSPSTYTDIVKQFPQYRGFINKLRDVIRDQKSYLHRLHRASELFFTAQQNFNKNSLEAAIKRNGGNSNNLTSSAKIGDKVIRDVMADREGALKKFGDGAIIKGNLAVKTAVLLTQGIKRVQLFNSGFYIVVRAPKLDELAEYWRDSTSAVDEYGKILGQLCYLPADIHYRRAGMNLLEKLVVDSNLEDYDAPDTLRKAISFLDFDTVMWAIGSLMFPRGLQVDYLCHNEGCRYVESGKVSVKDMRYNDWSLLEADDILYTSSNKKRKLSDLEKYREKIRNRNVTKKINDEWSAVFRIPTMFEMEESHLAHLADLSKKVQLTSLQEASMYIAVKYFGILSPFTEKLVYRSPESGKVINMVGDTLSSTLEALQSGDINFAETVDSFIADTKITHICFTFNKCPSCNNLPKSAIGHLIPCDVQRTFFTWIARRLTEQV